MREFTQQQCVALVGGAGGDRAVELGTALLSTIAASAITGYLTTHLARTAPGAGKLVQAQGAVHGYAVAFLWSAVILLAAALATVFLVTASPDELDAGERVVALH
ncbi:multidrug efflux MFS transporter [Streptomyces albireticuli]|uniref:multidrug efflux MFS transporter n=1 Tax=Streptomyces albireticuli TaxID=1940 RepID=UPI00117CD8DF|nr:multidrug efflux MFS transporter [Streptomyces albireticuli]MCD9145716.1 hypothetical protein [Streptomyces albireticuli]MCD9165552.1 hypothetical protein [Streptomyces albireticuli]MCD9195925.1 hypothetical protein [Streptomyces albireticuli]